MNCLVAWSCSCTSDTPASDRNDRISSSGSDSDTSKPVFASQPTCDTCLKSFGAPISAFVSFLFFGFLFVAFSVYPEVSAADLGGSGTGASAGAAGAGAGEGAGWCGRPLCRGAVFCDDVLLARAANIDLWRRSCLLCFRSSIFSISTFLRMFASSSLAKLNAVM